MNLDAAYFIIGVVVFLITVVGIGRTEFWQDEVLDDDDFFLYIMSWFLRILASFAMGLGWFIAIPIALLVTLAYIGWCNQQQRRHVKRWNYEDDDYNWRKQLLPERFQKENEDQH